MCQENEGTLAHVTSPEDIKLIDGFVSRLGDKYFMWLGLDDRKKEGEFRWSNGMILTLANWQHDKPNNVDPNNFEDCVVVCSGYCPKDWRAPLGKWRDIQCQFRTKFSRTFLPLCDRRKTEGT